MTSLGHAIGYCSKANSVKTYGGGGAITVYDDVVIAFPNLFFPALKKKCEYKKMSCEEKATTAPLFHIKLSCHFIRLYAFFFWPRSAIGIAEIAARVDVGLDVC